MTTPWTVEELDALARDYPADAHAEVAALIAGARAVVALCAEAAPRRMGDGYLSASVLDPGDVVAALSLEVTA